jgi:hypothetical protein
MTRRWIRLVLSKICITLVSRMWRSAASGVGINRPAGTEVSWNGAMIRITVRS